MGWLSKLLGATPKEELQGLQLELNQPFWELEGETHFASLLRALDILLPQDSILYFEGGSPNRKLLEFFEHNSIPEKTHVAVSILWPRPCYEHVPATTRNLEMLATIADSCADPELAVHFHAYKDNQMLLEWHDAFTQPMLVSGQLAEPSILRFANTLGMTAKPCKAQCRTCASS